MSERRYWLQTEGFDGYEIRSSSAGKARWASFRSYDEAGYGHATGRTQSERFRRFLERTICHALGPADRPLAHSRDAM